MFGGEFSGWCCGSCSTTINAQEYAGYIYGVSALPFLSSYQATVPYVYNNPYVTIYDVFLEDSDSLPSQSDLESAGKQNIYYMTKCHAAYWPWLTDGVLANQYELPSAYTNWKVELPNNPIAYSTCYPGSQIYITGGSGDSIVTTNLGIAWHDDFIVSHSHTMLGAWGSWLNGRQDKVIYYAYLQDPMLSDRFNTEFSDDEDRVNGSLCRIQIDKASQSIDEVKIQDYGWSVFPYTAPEGIAASTSKSLSLFGPNNISVGKNSFIRTGYDDEPSDTQYIVNRSWRESEASSWNESGGIAILTNTGEYQVVRGSRIVHSDNGEPYVIAKAGDAWAIGKWRNNDFLYPELAELEPPEQDLTLKAVLNPDEVETVVTAGGEMLESARCLCYNRIGTRDLALFVEIGIEEDSGDCTEDPSLTDRYFNRVWLYDSNRTSNKLFLYSNNSSACFDPTVDNPYNENDCFISNEQYDIYTIDQYYYNPSVFSFLNYLVNSDSRLPTYIVADQDGDVYVGSPKFIRKIGALAAAESESYEWEIDAVDHYETVLIDAYCGGTTTKPELFGRQFGNTTNAGAQTYDYGHIDYRNFAILPAGGKIQVRGFEGVIEMSRWQGEPLDCEISSDDHPNSFSYSKLSDTLPLSLATRANSHWIHSWTISPDGQNIVPHLEGYCLAHNGDYHRDPPEYNAINIWEQYDEFGLNHTFAGYEAMKDATSPPEDPTKITVRGLLESEPNFYDNTLLDNYVATTWRLGPRWPTPELTVTLAAIGWDGDGLGGGFGYSAMQTGNKYWMQPFEWSGRLDSTGTYHAPFLDNEGQEFPLRMQERLNYLVFNANEVGAVSTPAATNYCVYNYLSTGSINASYGLNYLTYELFFDAVDDYDNE